MNVKKWISLCLSLALLFGGLPGALASPDEVGDLFEGRAVFWENGKAGFLDERGQTVVPAVYDEVRVYEDGFARVAMEGPDGASLWGLIDRTGREVVPCAYLWVLPNGFPQEGLAEVCSREERYGAVRLSDGAEVYPCRYRSHEALKAAVAAGTDDVDILWRQASAGGEKAGLQVTWYPEAESLTRLYGSERMLLEKDGRYGLFGLDGTQYTGCVFDAVEPFDENGLAWAMQAGKWGRIDLSGKAVVDFQYETLELAKHPVNVRILQKGGMFAIAKLDGTLLTDYIYWNAKPFVNGYAALQDNHGNWGYIDGEGKVAVPFRYYADIGGMGDFGTDGLAYVYAQDRAAAKRISCMVDTQGREFRPGGSGSFWRAGQGMWGFMKNYLVGFTDSQGNVVIEPKYDYVTSPKGEMQGNYFGKDGIAKVYLPWDGTTQKELYIDMAGNVVEGYDPTTTWERFYEGLEKADNEDFLWGFRDEAGNWLVPCLYDAVGDFDHGYASVRADGIYGMLKNPILHSPWAAAEIQQAAAEGYVTDRCRFYQTDPITRLQFAELAVNYLEKATGTTLEAAKETTFTDTMDTAVLKAYAAGIVEGRGEGVFDPAGLLTRQELAAMLYRALTKAEVKWSGNADLTAYADGGDAADWAVEALSALTAAGILNGTGENSLSPGQTCTVEEAILLVYRSVK